MIRRVAFGFALLLALAAPAQGAERSERWYVLEMAGSRAGWARSLEVVQDDGRILTEQELLIRVARGPATVEIEIFTSFLETAEGEPVRMESAQKLGGFPVMQAFEFRVDHVAVTSRQADRVTTSVKPWPEGEWLPPAAVSRRAMARLEAGDKEIALVTIDPLSGLTPITTTMRVKGETTVRVLGKVVPAIEWVVTTSAAPGIESVEFIDRHGAPVLTEINMGFIQMKMLAAEKEIALLESEPAEMMVRTFVTPEGVVKDARETTSGAYVLSLPDGELPELPSGGAQRFERIDARSGRVRVRMDGEGAGDVDPAPYLASSLMADTSDPRLIELTRGALDGVGDDPAEKAEALRRFVHRYIDEKSLDVGYATASEVCRTREGDCTEHAALLAALMRVAGVPSRTVSGLIYADSFAGARRIFGYHAWTQALVEVDGQARWVDYDATLRNTRFDATHIALSYSDLAGSGVSNEMAVLAPLLGRLQIRVEAASR